MGRDGSIKDDRLDVMILVRMFHELQSQQVIHEIFGLVQNPESKSVTANTKWRIL